MSVGAELAEARQSLALSLEELSARTKISVERLTAIEQVDVAQLPSLVYLKGFLRAYAAEVQLDPDDVAQRYLSEVEIAAPEFSVLGSAPGSPTPPGERALERADDWEAQFLPENALAAELPLATSEPEPRLSSTGKYFAVVDPHESAPSPSISRSSSTRYLAAVVVLMVAAAAGWALSANFDTITGSLKRMRAPTESNRTAARETAAPVVAPDARPSDVTTNSATKSDGMPASATRDSSVDVSRGRAVSTTKPERRTAPTVAGGNEATASSAAAAPSEAASDGPPNLTGSWALTNRVESSSYEAFNNLNLGFHLQLQQRGNRVTGTGQKWMENGRAIPARSRTPIAVEGTLTDRRLELTFTERGARRTSAGTFVMDVADDGTLRGTFTSDAAKAQGTSLARRMSSPNR